MKRLSNLAGLLALGLTMMACGTYRPASDLDVVLTGGTVYTGDNSEGYVTDVWINGDRIVGMGDLGRADADLVLDVTGLAVVPGFIDLHNHAIRDSESGSGLFRWPDAENLVRQGNTTVVGGPDGWSPLPLEEAFKRVEANPAAVNFGAFVGHGAVRTAVVGLDDRPPTGDELDRMRSVVDLAMRQGAFGLSSGLVYTPGQFADTAEVVELAKVAARHGGIYISHMRNEALEVLDSVAELIQIAAAADIPAQITHAKLMGTAMQGRAPELLSMVDEAVERGLDITLDQYPYAAGRTSLTVQFPRWSVDGGAEALGVRLTDPEQAERIQKELVYQLKNVRGRNDPANVQLSQCDSDPSLNGLNLAQVLDGRGEEVTIDHAASLIMELQLNGGCEAIYHSMHPDDVETIIRHPRTMVASDGAIESIGAGHPHPRTYGSFARALGRYARDNGVIPFHTAIHKMTQMPAERIGLQDRGRIAPGMVADIAVIDPEKFIDRATFDNPHQYAEGALHVFVAGKAVLLNGEMTGARPGRVLRSASFQITTEEDTAQ